MRSTDFLQPAVKSEGEPSTVKSTRPLAVGSQSFESKLCFQGSDFGTASRRASERPQTFTPGSDEKVKALRGAEIC